MARKWRPGLAFVLFGALAGTLALSFVGLVVLRYSGPEFGYRISAALIGLVIALATLVLGYLLVRLLLRPITELQRFALGVSSGRGGDVAPPRHFGTTELNATAQSVMTMAQTLQSREATIRSFSDHVTHELKTPVAAIRAASELLRDGGALSEADQRLLAQISGANDQMETLLEAMRAVVQARETRHDGQTTLTALRPALERAVPGLALVFSGADQPLPMAAQGLEIVLGHLLTNAAHHAATQVQLHARQDDLAVALSVADDGQGISAGNASRLFDPFFTTRRDSGGTGMGLAIVRNMLRAQGGEISARPSRSPSRSASRSGACFDITFPRR